jgi:hypothetical protein
MGRHRRKKVQDEKESTRSRFKSRPFLITILVSALVGAIISNSFDVSKWFILDWLTRDREQITLKHGIVEVQHQIGRLDKLFNEDRAINFKERQSLRSAIDDVKHKIVRIEDRMDWLHGPGSLDDLRTLGQYREWRRQQDESQQQKELGVEE